MLRGRRKKEELLPVHLWVQDMHTLAGQGELCVGHMVPNTAADFPDCYVQGPRGLALDTPLGPGTGARTLGRESSFHLPAVGRVVSGETLVGVYTPFFTYRYTKLTYLL